MAIERIDSDICNGCGVCVNSCWLDVIRMDEVTNKAVIKYPGECMACAVCEMDCPQKAIYVGPNTPIPMATCWGP